MPLRLVLPGTSGTGMAWCHHRKVVLGVVSVFDPLLSPTSGSVMALVRDRSFSHIVGLVVVFRAPSFSPIVGLGLTRGPMMWVTLSPTLVSIGAPNRPPPDCK